MKKVIGFLALAGVLGSAAWLLSWWEHSRTVSETSVRSFTFREPIPEEILNQNQVFTPLLVEEVYLSGTMNNWSDRHLPHRMSLQKDGSWTLTLTLAPGQVQYKFVVYLKGSSTPVWTHDVFQPARIEDGYGGYNSLTGLDEAAWWLVPLFYIFIGLGLLSLLMGLMEAVSILVFRYGLSERVRSLVLIWLAAVFALGFALFMNMESQRSQARNTVTDSMNLFHLFLTGEGFRPGTLKEQRTAAEVFQKARSWFFGADARSSSRIFNNKQTILRALFLFDRDLKLVSSLERQQETGRTAYWVRKTGTRSSSLYFQNYLLKDLLAEARGRAVPPTGLFGKENPQMLEGLPKEARDAAWVLGFNAVLIPIYDNREVMGYYGALIHPEIYSESLYQLLFMNLFWLLAITTTAFLYYFVLPKPKDETLEKMNRFASRYQLSGREREVLSALIKGMSNQDIGEKLFISEGTVKVHVHKIYQKSGVSSRMELLDHLSNIQ